MEVLLETLRSEQRGGITVEESTGLKPEGLGTASGSRILRTIDDEE